MRAVRCWCGEAGTGIGAGDVSEGQDVVIAVVKLLVRMRLEDDDIAHAVILCTSGCSAVLSGANIRKSHKFQNKPVM